MTSMLQCSRILLLTATAILCGCSTASPDSNDKFSHFVGLDEFSDFMRSQNAAGETVLVSPVVNSVIEWNQLIVSWNAGAPRAAVVKVEAQAVSTNHSTKFYTMGIWSPDNVALSRSSVRGQKDSYGDVNTDTLKLNHTANGARIRVTLGGADSAPPTLKFLGMSFCNTKVAPASRPSNHAAWGKIISTPERSQKAYPQEKGWCSPTALSMVLSRWGETLHRPELNLDVPQVAAAVYDKDYDGTGNWPFNTAFTGSFNAMRSYVTRFDDLTEVEDWIVAGIPVILSARWDLLQPGRPLDTAGHLVVCIGFTKDGDPVINDPATNLKTQTVRRIYKREDVIRSWATSHNTVYLVYPESAKIPKNRFGHW
jgi:Peptidase_C39 like family